MKLEIEVPDDLAKVVAALIRQPREDLDGMEDVIIMEEFGLTTEQFVKASSLMAKIVRLLEASEADLQADRAEAEAEREAERKMAMRRGRLNGRK